MQNSCMYISPQYTTDDWKKLTFSKEDDWQRAIDIFEDRIRGRFLDLVEIIKKRTYAGFAVLALDCLLMETLQQFYEGKPCTPDRESGEYFRRFLTKTSFENNFDNKKAKFFYKHIRNGILHQGEIKKNSRVTIKQNIPLVAYTDDKKGIIVNRNRLHQKLVKEFNSYVVKLRNPSNQEERAKFREKMDYICRVAGEAR